jgi:hypothetical protein
MQCHALRKQRASKRHQDKHAYGANARFHRLPVCVGVFWGWLPDPQNEDV